MATRNQRLTSMNHPAPHHLRTLVSENTPDHSLSFDVMSSRKGSGSSRRRWIKLAREVTLKSQVTWVIYLCTPAVCLSTISTWLLLHSVKWKQMCCCTLLGRAYIPPLGKCGCTQEEVLKTVVSFSQEAKQLYFHYLIYFLLPMLVFNRDIRQASRKCSSIHQRCLQEMGLHSFHF